MAVFVLVPGAFHGGWCYSRVASRLRSRGHDVHTPTLSGVGERAHLAAQAINLSTHIQDVVAKITAHDLEDVVLCGHSYTNLQLSYTYANWSASLWSTNVFNERYFPFVLNTTGLGAGYLIRGIPRMYGARLRADF